MRSFVAALFVTSLWVGFSREGAVSDLCGVTVTQDVRLDGDLTCIGDGLTVGADGIRIDLNGHTIQGSGTGVGIAMTGHHNVTISGGQVRGFAVAVRINTVTGVVIRDIEFMANAEGIDAQAGSIGNTIKDSVFRDHPIRAIMLRGDARENEIKANTFTGNRLGIQVFGGENSQIKDNDFSGSSVAAIRFGVLATGNVIKDNRIEANAAGLEFVVTPTGSSSTGNEMKDNTLTGNGCAVKGPTAGNTLKDNYFVGNLADACS